MDDKWDPQIYHPSDPEWIQKLGTSILEEHSKRALKNGQVLSKLICATPHDPLLWFQRGNNFLRLGLPELAMGDLHKCIILCDVGMASVVAVSDERCKNFSIHNAVHKALMKTTNELDFTSADDAFNDLQQSEVNQILIDIHENATLALIEAMFRAKCLQDAADLAEAMMQKIPAKQSLYREIRERAIAWLQRFLDEQPCLEGDAALMAKYFGKVYRRIYPWMTEQQIMRPPETIEQIKSELSDHAPHCSLMHSQHDFDELYGDDFSVFATCDIQAGETLAIDQHSLTNHDPSLTSSKQYPCDYRYAYLVSPPTSGSLYPYSGQLVIPSDPSAIRKQERTLERLYPPIQILPKLLAVCLSAPRENYHPFSHPVISRWRPDYRPVPFALSFKLHIQRPLEILDRFGVDVFSDARFDTWVILNLLNRISSNMLSREQLGEPMEKLSTYPSSPDSPSLKIVHGSRESHSQSDTIHSLGYLLPLFNHSCDPNLRIYPQNEFTVVRASRSIRRGEELCVSYINLTAGPKAYGTLKKWFNDCACQVCRPKEEAIEGSQLPQSYECHSPLKL